MDKSAAVVGYAEMAPQKNPEGLTTLGIIAQIAKKAVLDAGLELNAIDGLITGQSLGEGHRMLWPSIVCEYLGLEVKLASCVELGGASGAGMLWRAVEAVRGGVCQHVLCVVGDVVNSKRMALMPPPFSNAFKEFELPYGMAGAIPGYAQMTMRHMHEYGTTAEQLAKVAVEQRKNALLNPDALFNNKALTIEDVLSSRVLCEPIHLLEIVSPCSGGAAFVVSRPVANKPVVYLLGYAEAAGNHSTMFPNSASDYLTTLVKRTAANAFRMAKLSQKDVNACQLYDAFPIIVALTLEDAGFCKKGSAGNFIDNHDLSFSGDFPVNTHGGQLSFGQPGLAGGVSHVIEGIRQLMGRGENRQVPDAQKIYVANGGMIGQHCSLILAN